MYRSGLDRIVEDFYHPALHESRTYLRAVGFFRSSALETVGEPLGDFVERGGSMRLVTSVRLHEDDVRAIEEGLSLRDVCEARLLKEIHEGFREPLGRGSWLLSQLLKSGKLELRIAQPSGGEGIYHEKVGVFIDDDDDYVSFSGSFNESRSAFERNYECLHVYPSWEMPLWAADERCHFEDVWSIEEDTPGVRTFDFPDAARRDLIEVLERATSRGGRSGIPVKR